jgi:CRP-like cAMP-binding protein
MNRLPPSGIPANKLHVRGKNRLLTMLEKAGGGEVVSRMERVKLRRRTSLASPHQPITHAYFPLTGVASLSINLQDGAAVEIGTMGNEGMVGIPLLLGGDRSLSDAFVQVEGEFLRIDSLAFAGELRRGPHMAAIGRLYTQGFLELRGQSAACLRFHPVEQRLCRWILDAHDRMGNDTLLLTEDFLVLMLGVQRPIVSNAVAQLQEAGFVEYGHGVMDVLDRPGLEAAACVCYETVRDNFERLLC